MGPAAALFYVWSRSTANVLIGRLRRLRQPKYLLGGIGAAAYLWFLFVRPALMPREAREMARTGTPEVFTTVGALAMLLLFVLVWLWRRKRAALSFTDAEIAFLFPGPVTHSTLVHYSLVRMQVAGLFSAFIIALLGANWNIETIFWARFIGWWLVLAVIGLHVTLSGFVLTRLMNRGIPQWLRQVAVAVLAVTAAWLVNVADPELRLPLASDMGPGFAAYLQEHAGSGPLYWMLLPFRLLLAPMVAADGVSFLTALPGALLVYALHYAGAWWSELPDNEEALALAAKRAGFIAAARKGNLRAALVPPKSRPDPFRLAARGTPVIAFLWKNLLSTREYINLRTLLVVAALLLAWDFWMQSPPRYPVAAAIPTLVAFIAGMQTLLFGPQLARQDLRSDMENADLIKTWPLEGWQIVLGEMLAPAAILTGVLWLCLLQIGLAIDSAPTRFAALAELRVVAGVSIALVLPFLCGVQLLVANAAAVLFPAWTKHTGLQNQGIEVGIQRLLFFAGQWLAMMIALAPALLFGLLVYIPASWYLENLALLPAAIVVATVLAAELAWGINWLGERFDAYDLSA